MDWKNEESLRIFPRFAGRILPSPPDYHLKCRFERVLECIRANVHGRPFHLHRPRKSRTDSVLLPFFTVQRGMPRTLEDKRHEFGFVPIPKVESGHNHVRALHLLGDDNIYSCLYKSVLFYVSFHFFLMVFFSGIQSTLKEKELTKSSAQLLMFCIWEAGWFLRSRVKKMLNLRRTTKTLKSSLKSNTKK